MLKFSKDSGAVSVEYGLSLACIAVVVIYSLHLFRYFVSSQISVPYAFYAEAGGTDGGSEENAPGGGGSPPPGNPKGGKSGPMP